MEVRRFVPYPKRFLFGEEISVERCSGASNQRLTNALLLLLLLTLDAPSHPSVDGGLALGVNCGLGQRRSRKGVLDSVKETHAEGRAGHASCAATAFVASEAIPRNNGKSLCPGADGGS